MSWQTVAIGPKWTQVAARARRRGDGCVMRISIRSADACPPRIPRAARTVRGPASRAGRVTILRLLRMRQRHLDDIDPESLGSWARPPAPTSEQPASSVGERVPAASPNVDVDVGLDRADR